jgi:type I restriction enzyme, S subunit
MNNLPDGWAQARLGELGLYFNGRGFKRSEWSAFGRPIIRIQNLTGSGDSYNYYSGHLEDRYTVRQGDLLISWAATLGAFIWGGPEAALNQHIFKVHSFIDKKFHYYLVSHLLNDLQRQTHGSGMVHVTKTRFDETPVNVPPMPEQLRIVAELDQHLSRLNAAALSIRSAEQKGQVLARRLLDARLEDLSTTTCSLGSVLREPLSNGRSVPTDSRGFPVLRLTALRDGKLALSERKGGRWTAAEASPFLVQRGDFYISRGNGSLSLVGRGALLEEDPDPIAFPDTMVRIRLNHKMISPEYLRLVWGSRMVRRQIEGSARTTAGIYKINQQMIERIRIPVPGLSIQEQVVSELSEGLDRIDRVGMQVHAAGSRADRLRRSVLATALTGRLVRQSSTDEPASELLARIRMQRQIVGGKRSVRRAKNEAASQKGALL